MSNSNQYYIYLEQGVHTPDDLNFPEITMTFQTNISFTWPTFLQVTTTLNNKKLFNFFYKS